MNGEHTFAFCLHDLPPATVCEFRQRQCLIIRLSMSNSDVSYSQERIAHHSRARLSSLYDSLPPEAKRELLLERIIPLLDSPEIALSETKLMSNKYKDLPDLDINTKRTEVTTLLDALSRESKRSIMHEHTSQGVTGPDGSIRDIMQALVNCLTSWMQIIWSTAYEYQCVQYVLAGAHNDQEEQNKFRAGSQMPPSDIWCFARCL